MNLVWGLAIGAIYAVADGLLFYWVMARAAREAAPGRMLFRGMAARWLLTMAVVVLALLLPFADAAGVVIALIVQKAALLVLALLRGRKNS